LRASAWAGVSLCALLAASPALSQALPTGGEVAAGSAVIGAASPTRLTVTQTSARAILNWKSFSVGDGASVRFDNGRGATLNRVTGGDLSKIDGRLSASGSVYLINPAGVIVGNNGVISTGGTFLASSLDLPDASFMSGGALTFSGSGDAGVVNLGRITATSGDIAWRLLESFDMDGVIVDITLPGIQGIDLIPFAAARGSAIIAISGHHDVEVPTIYSRGAHVFLRKPFLSSDITAATIRHLPAKNSKNAALENISAREFEVLSLIRKGCESSQIAAILGISPNTVAFHRKSIRRKHRQLSFIEICALYFG
jgi:filamentous hemagglutinin family protein